VRVLIGCEKSGVVRRAMRARGADAWSCDLEPADDGSPFHLRCDVLEVLRDRWDLAIFHPECRYLCASGMHWVGKRSGRLDQLLEAAEFARKLFNAPIPRICLENSVGFLSRFLRAPDQIVQPWQFGDDASKATALWLYRLPPLKIDPALFYPPRFVCCGHVVASGDKYGCLNCAGEKIARPRWSNQTDSGQNKLPPSKNRSALRAETYPGIARAMAETWIPEVIP